MLGLSPTSTERDFQAAMRHSWFNSRIKGKRSEVLLKLLDPFD